MILRTVDINLHFDPGKLFDDIREIQFSAYRAWQDDILDMIDSMWRGWVEETGRSRRGFSVAFNPNTGDIEILNNAESPRGVQYAQYVHRAGSPRSDLYIDHVMRRLLAGPIAEMIEYIESELEDLIAKNVNITYRSTGRPG